MIDGVHRLKMLVRSTCDLIGSFLGRFCLFFFFFSFFFSLLCNLSSLRTYLFILITMTTLINQNPIIYEASAGHSAREWREEDDDENSADAIDAQEIFGTVPPFVVL